MIINKKEIKKAIQNLQNGFLIVYPTDTLYALGADVFNKKAVKQVFNIKKRPYSIPLPIAVSNYNMLKEIAKVNNISKKLADKFLPGPLTLILKKKTHISDIVTSGSKKVAVRIPNNNIALKLLSNFGPLSVTSANIHRKKTLGVIKDVRMQFKQDDVSIYLDNGKLEGKPSTIVDTTDKKLRVIREGVIPKEKIMEVL